jgi:anti-sigma factor RsiW
MMNCSEVRELIQLYMDNELDARNTLAVQRHLEGCSVCAAQLDYFIKQDQALKQVATAETADNAEVRETIHARIRQESAAKPQPSAAGSAPWLRVLLRRPVLFRVAAALLIAVVAAFFLLRGSAPLINDKVYAAAVEDHAHHCTLDMLEKLKGSVRDLEQIDKLCAENGKFKKTPDLSGFGFANIRARYCGIKGVKVLHLVYQSETEQPLSIFMCLHSIELIDGKLLTLKREGYEVASFMKSGVDVFVVSALDEAQTSAIAKTLAEDL